MGGTGLTKQKTKQQHGRNGGSGRGRFSITKTRQIYSRRKNRFVFGDTVFPDDRASGAKTFPDEWEPPMPRKLFCPWIPHETSSPRKNIRPRNLFSWQQRCCLYISGLPPLAAGLILPPWGVVLFVVGGDVYVFFYVFLNMSADICWFPLIFFDFRWFSLSSIDFHWFPFFLLIFIDFY